MILVCFLAGVFVGLGDFAPEWLLGHDLPIIILSLLIVQVGISLGSNNDLRGLFHSLNPRMSLLPVFTIGGTLLFSAIGVFLLHGRDLNDCLTIGSGFGYYSLSSVLIADIKSATLGPQGAAELATIALLRAQVYKRFFYHRLVFFDKCMIEIRSFLWHNRTLNRPLNRMH